MIIKIKRQPGQNKNLMVVLEDGDESILLSTTEITNTKPLVCKLASMLNEDAAIIFTKES
jgi:hypothetical protein